jgi:hypothetical protein
MTHLIHIGFPRTGSTYLRYYFSQSPYYVHQMRGVSGFKQSIDIVHYSYSPKPDARYFVVSEEEFSCWSGPNFSLSSFNRSYDVVRFRKNLVQTLKDFYRHPKILIITRSHEAIIKSLYAQYINYGGRMGFIEFIQSANGDILKELLDYKATIHLYEREFGSENIIVLPYEMMQDNTHQFMEVLCQKLKVPLETISIDKINSSLSLQYLENSIKLSSIVYKLLGLLGKNKERFFNYYAYLLMNRKFDWALGFANLFGKKIDLQSEFNSITFRDYLKKFPSQQELVQHESYYSSYLSYYR